MSKNEFLNFAEISKNIKFNSVLDWLSIPYSQTSKELRGEGFVVSKEKNLYFSTSDDSAKGSIINFVAQKKQIGLREAATLLKQTFLAKKEKDPKREIPNLQLVYDELFNELLIKPEVVAKYEIGYVKQRSIIAGKIAIKMYDNSGSHIGYIGYNKKDKSWFFPKGFIRPLYNFHNITDYKSTIITTDPFDALRIISLGFSQTVSLLAKSMSTEQENTLKKFRYAILFHHEPVNIVSRLCDSIYIKAPMIKKSLIEYSNEEIISLIKPSQ